MNPPSIAVNSHRIFSGTQGWQKQMNINEHQWFFEAPNYKMVSWPVVFLTLPEHNPCRICYCQRNREGKLRTPGLFPAWSWCRIVDNPIWQPSIIKTAKKIRTAARARPGTSRVLRMGRGYCFCGGFVGGACFCQEIDLCVDDSVFLQLHVYKINKASESTFLATIVNTERCDV